MSDYQVGTVVRFDAVAYEIEEIVTPEESHYQSDDSPPVVGLRTDDQEALRSVRMTTEVLDDRLDHGDATIVEE